MKEENIEKKFEDIEKCAQELNKQHEKFFNEIGISPHQLHHFLNDPERCPKELKEKLDANNIELKKLIDQKVDEGLKKSGNFNRTPLEGLSHQA